MPDAAARAKAIRLALFDVDGVLTDGRLYYGPDGEAMKVFSILDGHGLKMLARSGVATGLISGRKAFQRPMAEGVRLLNAIQDVYLCADVTIA